MKKIIMMGTMAISSFLSAQTPIQVDLWGNQEGIIVNEKPVIQDRIDGKDILKATLTIYPAKKRRSLGKSFF